jgi:hypothetical protein
MFKSNDFVTAFRWNAFELCQNETDDLGNYSRKQLENDGLYRVISRVHGTARNWTDLSRNRTQ